MTLHERVHTDMVSAMKEKKEPHLTVLRSILTMCTNELTSPKRTSETLTDEEVLTLIRRAVKQRKDAAQQFRDGGREDLAQNEEREVEVLEVYLPHMMPREEIVPVAREKMQLLNIADKKHVGKLIGAVMSELKGKADGADVKAVVEDLLN